MLPGTGSDLEGAFEVPALSAQFMNVSHLLDAVRVTERQAHHEDCR